MRKIYVVRHGQIAQEYTDRCISRTDILLDAVGKEQARSLAEWFLSHSVSAVYTSPLRRCKDTAKIMAGDQTVCVHPQLAEIQVGAWEGFSFAEIRKKWPEEYAARGEHMGTTAPPGGESFCDGGERMHQVMQRLLYHTQGDLLVVTHGGILRGWLCKITGQSPDQVFAFNLPYGSITEISVTGNTFQLEKTGYRPTEFPGPEEIRFLMEKYHTPQEVQRHCLAVADKAMELARGFCVDTKLLYTAALLHDLCRTEGRDHPQKAADVLKKAGYSKVAELVLVHNDLEAEKEEDICEEAKILFLADKLFVGTRPVTLKERFDRSREKCKDDAALAAWNRRWCLVCRLSERYMR